MKGVQANRVEKPFYTRDGSFKLKANGEVVTSDGLSVMGFFGEAIGGGLVNLIIPTQKLNETTNNVSIISNINVDSKGKITATYGLDDEEVIGSFELASFINETGLNPVGTNRYQFNANSGEPKYDLAMEKSLGKIEAGNLERWNVENMT